MVPSSRLCQQFPRLRPISLSLVLASSHLWLLLLANCGLLGCWQEVRYEPANLAKSESLKAETVAAPFESPVTEAPAPSPVPTEGSATAEQTTPPVTPLEEPLIPESRDPSVDQPFAAESPVTLPEQDVLPDADREELPAAESDPLTASVELPTAVTALAAWQMSSEWSMAVALQAKNAQPQRYKKHLEAAQPQADLLQMTLPALNERIDDSAMLEPNLNLLLEEAGPGLASQLSEQQGAAPAALAELAIKSHALLLNYVPNSPELEPLIAAIERSAHASGLPESVWGELTELLAEKAPFREIKAAIFRLHKAAAAQLETAVAR